MQFCDTVWNEVSRHINYIVLEAAELEARQDECVLIKSVTAQGNGNGIGTRYWK